MAWMNIEEIELDFYRPPQVHNFRLPTTSDNNFYHITMWPVFLKIDLKIRELSTSDILMVLLLATSHVRTLWPSEC